MSIRASRTVGVLISAIGLGAALLYYRGTREPALVVDTPRATRGGQIVGTTRSNPQSFNRLVVRDQTSDTINLLTQGRLVRINRATFELEPWLAERWESTPDGLTHTLHLRQGVTWSDGAPFTSADVTFSLQAALDPRVSSVIAGNLVAGGQPIRADAPDEHTVVLRYAAPSGLGLRLLDGLPILPRHKLGAALDAGTLAEAWGPATPPSDIVGLGPFVLREFQPGQRIVLDRNPRYWRTAPDGQALPYLDRIVFEVVPEQNAEFLRLASGNADFTHTELRAEDYAPARRAEQEGRIKLVELGVGTDADAFWFCLKPEVKQKDPRFAFVQRREFRQAISHAVDREAFAQTVFLGEAVPIWGPVTPGNSPWFSPNVPRYPHDAAKARELLKNIGLEDRDGNGIVEDAAGTEARFTVLTQRGITFYERGTTVLRDYLQDVGIALDVVPLEVGALIKRLVACDYDAIYYRPVLTDLDPGGTLDFWLSSGTAHFWNIAQAAPATDWERQIDTLMQEQARTVDPERRKALFDDVQRVLGENVPVLYFVAPRLFYGHSARLAGVVPSVLRPQLLWTADTLSVTGASASGGSAGSEP